MTEKTFLKTFIYIWAYIPVVFFIVFFVSGRNWDMAFNFFLGAVVSLMLMSHNYKTTMKTAQNVATELRARALKNYFFRYFFYGLILAITLLRYNDVKYLIPVFIGFTSFKVVMMILFLVARLRGDLDD